MQDPRQFTTTVLFNIMMTGDILVWCNLSYKIWLPVALKFVIGRRLLSTCRRYMITGRGKWWHLHTALQWHCQYHSPQMLFSIGWGFGVVVSALVSINKVNLCWARLVLRWVTMSGVQLLVPENLPQYITSDPGQLSLATPTWVGTMSTSQRAVMPFGWGLKADMLREWVTL